MAKELTTISPEGLEVANSYLQFGNIRGVCDHLQVAENKVVDILNKTGNCISASIPMGIHQLISMKMLKKEQTIFMCGTSAGFSIGSLLYKHG